MRRVALFASAIGVLFTLSACGGGDDKKPSDKASADTVNMENSDEMMAGGSSELIIVAAKISREQILESQKFAETCLASNYKNCD